MLFRLQQSREKSFIHNYAKELSVKGSWLSLHRRWRQGGCFW